jgi:opacity protein-like surface antigen
MRYSILARALLLQVLLIAPSLEASAADLPVKAPPPAPLPTWSWTGFYVGGHLGGAFEYSALQDPFGPVSFGDKVTTTAVLGGGQIGANYQFGQVVVGGEADFSWVNSRGDETCFGLTGGKFYASNCSVDPSQFSTLTGRLGYAFGRTLVYGKAGAAWEHTDVAMAVNNNPGQHFLASTNSYGAWGWTAGAGIEYALTPAWSLMLEYDYLDFGSSSVATPYVPGNPLPGHPVGPIAGLSSNVQEVKMGINYRFGADPAIWPTGASASPILPSMPLKARPRAVAASGWEIEGGARYMYSSGRAQWEFAGRTAPAWFNNSKLTWNDMKTNSAELFGRVDTPSNIFFSGFAGAGLTFSGGQNDEDFRYPNRAYNNTFSNNKGDINYAVADVGYDVWRNPDYKVGPFIGYTVFNQYIFKTGCQQVASPLGNCVTPLSNSQLIGTEDMTWQAMRVGLSGQVSLTDRLRLTADAAYLPYVTYGWLDDHLERNLQWNNWGQGIGVQTQAVLSYDVTDRLSVGVGGRYWAMWSTTGNRVTFPGSPTPEPTRNTVDLLGVFVQTSYRFDSDRIVAAKPAGFDSSVLNALSFKAPAFKAPIAPVAYDWTGFYVGVEGGGIFGSSYQVGQLTTGGRHTADSTPPFDVDGGMIGGTIGYNAQFSRIFVFGLEGDMSWTDASGSAHQIPPFLATQVATTNEDWLATARIRLGVTPADHWLVYGTGGLAAAEVGAVITNANGTIAFPEQSWLRPGWTAGGGVEAAFTANWSAKLEYLYVGLENHGYFVPTPNNSHVTNRAGGVPLDEQIVRAGINYKTNWGLPTAGTRS